MVYFNLAYFGFGRFVDLHGFVLNGQWRRTLCPAEKELVLQRNPLGNSVTETRLMSKSSGWSCSRIYIRFLHGRPRHCRECQGATGKTTPILGFNPGKKWPLQKCRRAYDAIIHCNQSVLASTAYSPSIGGRYTCGGWAESAWRYLSMMAHVCFAVMFSHIPESVYNQLNYVWW